MPNVLIGVSNLCHSYFHLTEQLSRPSVNRDFPYIQKINSVLRKWLQSYRHNLLIFFNMLKQFSEIVIYYAIINLVADAVKT